jgi:hypothetical protein
VGTNVDIAEGIKSEVLVKYLGRGLGKVGLDDDAANELNGSTREVPRSADLHLRSEP